MTTSLATSIRLALSLALLGGGGTARAAPQDAGKEQNTVVLETVEVSGTSDTGIRREEVTNRISIGREEIQRHNDDQLSSTLRRLPGVTVTAEGVRMRGLGGGYVQILLDGDPAPTGFSLDSIPPDLVERIEILPTAIAEYSTRSIAGTINIVLRKSASTRQRTLKLNAAKAGAEWYPSATLLFSGKRKGFSWSLSGTASNPKDRLNGVIDDEATDSSGATLYERHTRERYESENKTLNLAPRLTWDFGESNSFSWQSLLQYGKEEWSRDRNEEVLAGGPSEYPRNIWISDSRTLSAKTDGNWTREIGEGDSLNIKFGVNYLKRDTDFAFLGFAPAGDFALDRKVVSDAIDTSYTTVGKYVTHVGNKHSMTFGWDGAYTHRSESRLQHDLAPDGTLLDLIDEDYSAGISRIALYAQDEWQTAARLQTYLGLRWEGWNTSVSGRTIARISNRSSEFSPIAQMVWKLSENSKDQLRWGVARTFSAPLPRRLVPRRYTVNNGNGPTNPDQQGNPGLRPEIAWGLDAAYEHYFGKDAMVSLGGYVRRIDDVTLESLFEQDGIWISMPFNAGKARTHGLTLEAKFALSDLIQSTADIQFRGNLTRNWSRVDAVPGPDNRLANQTPFSGTFGVEWKMSERFSSGMDFSYVGSSFNRLSPVWSMSSWPERTLGAYANWKIDAASKITLSLSNLLHQTQSSRVSYQDPDGTSSRYYGTDSNIGIKLLYERQL
jgi:outer membrane receptor protein involved in Fe transport